ncbi:hypothetical protein D3C87_406010 [compost metagenome]
MEQLIIINFPGGIVSPGKLYHILTAADKVRVRYVRFGLRQQLLIDIASYNVKAFTDELSLLNIDYEVDVNLFPNIISSYPAEQIFIRNTWLTEGVYKDVFDAIDFKPSVKVNICDNNQSFTPMLTGNINWVASSQSPHYWHLIIRFPKTNVVYEWNQLCYTNSIAMMTKELAAVLAVNTAADISDNVIKGERLFSSINTTNFILKPAESAVTLSDFNLPYYEGLNRYNNKYWLGIYRRDELFSVDFLKSVCKLCLATKLGQLCCTSWKTIIIKGIEEQHKQQWNALLEQFEINMRHAANELNFQVEDNCLEGLTLKNYLVNYLSLADTRTFGICFGIKTRKKSEIFSSILIRKRFLVHLFKLKFFPVYDILCAKNFNPNERTGFVFSKGNPKFLLPEQLRRAVLKFYKTRASYMKNEYEVKDVGSEKSNKVEMSSVLQCTACLTVYDEDFVGEVCELCESDKNNFVMIEKSVLQLQ